MKTTFNIIGHAKIWFALSGTIITLALVALAVFGLNAGLDFEGGSLLDIRAPNTTVETIRGAVSGAGFDAVVQASGNDGYFVRLKPISESEHQTILAAIKTADDATTENQFTTIGPVIGEELKRSSAFAVVLLLALIGLYIAWAFRKVSHPVSSWKYGFVTMVAAFHDVIIPLGAFAVLGKFLGYQVDTAFVAALLTILGYSINDTIVVLDRTRENLVRHRHGDHGFGAIVNASVMETMARSVNTTLATLIPLVAIFVIGGETTRPFVLALIIGILSGAYSSIFVASPLLVYLEKKK